MKTKLYKESEVYIKKKENSSLAIFFYLSITTSTQFCLLDRIVPNFLNFFSKTLPPLQSIREFDLFLVHSLPHKFLNLRIYISYLKPKLCQLSNEQISHNISQ